ncbi:MAG: hypothetical protein ACR2RL_21660 [Gammaproteobacteria bacterium]
MSKSNHAQMAAIWCADKRFRAWLKGQHPRTYHAAENGWAFDPKEIAAVVVRKVCKVQSRSEFDSDREAAARFREAICKPWERANEAMQRAEWTT